MIGRKHSFDPTRPRDHSSQGPGVVPTVVAEASR